MYEHPEVLERIVGQRYGRVCGGEWLAGEVQTGDDGLQRVAESSGLLRGDSASEDLSGEVKSCCVNGLGRGERPGVWDRPDHEMRCESVECRYHELGRRGTERRCPRRDNPEALKSRTG